MLFTNMMATILYISIHDRPNLFVSCSRLRQPVTPSQAGVKKAEETEAGSPTSEGQSSFKLVATA